MIVCNKVLGVVETSSLSCDKSLSFLVDETPRVGMITEFLGGSVFRQIRGLQRKPLPEFVVFQVPTYQNNQYITEAYFVVASPELLQ